MVKKYVFVKIGGDWDIAALNLHMVIIAMWELNL